MGYRRGETREEFNARRRARYRNDEAYRRRILAIADKSYAKHRDKITAQRRQRYADDPEFRAKAIESAKESTTDEQRRRYNRNWRRRKKGLPEIQATRNNPEYQRRLVATGRVVRHKAKHEAAEHEDKPATRLEKLMAEMARLAARDK